MDKPIPARQSLQVETMIKLRLYDLKTILFAGISGEVLFEAYAWLISPKLFGLSLSPLKLVTAIVKKLSGIGLPPITAFALHFIVGAFVFPLALYLVHKVTRLNIWMSGLTTGILLWFVAQGILAPFIGRSFMMDFGPYTQSSFVGHVGMCLIMAAIMKARTGGMMESSLAEG